jgi:hypothetical protein
LRVGHRLQLDVAAGQGGQQAAGVDLGGLGDQVAAGLEADVPAGRDAGQVVADRLAGEGQVRAGQVQARGRGVGRQGEVAARLEGRRARQVQLQGVERQVAGAGRLQVAGDVEARVPAQGQVGGAGERQDLGVDLAALDQVQGPAVGPTAL